MGVTKTKIRTPFLLLAISVLSCFGRWHRVLLTSAAYGPSSSSSSSKPQFHVAPMQGYTNVQTRKMFDLLSPSSIKWTEMEKLDDIYPKTESADYLLDALEKRLGTPGAGDTNDRLVLQLGTNDPDRLQSCVEHAFPRYDSSIQEINLNCGCPAIESGGATTYGASLMKNARLTGELVRAARRGLGGLKGRTGELPSVSVKCRIAVFETDQDRRPLTERDYEFIREYISTIHENGADHVILHARPAILTGLSPVKNRIVPELDYGFVERIASEFEGKLDITLNGGITTLNQLHSFFEKSKGDTKHVLSSYMAGRWCLRRPLDLIDIEALLKNNESSDSSVTSSTNKSSFSLIQTAIEQYVDDAIAIGSSSSTKHRPTIADLCLPLFLIVEQLRDDYNYEIDDDITDWMGKIQPPLLSCKEMEELYNILEEEVAQIENLFGSGNKKKKKSNGSVNFKHLSSSFKPLVGTKVANKWKRNRTEL